jgi:hypothetical protein
MNKQTKYNKKNKNKIKNKIKNKTKKYSGGNSKEEFEKSKGILDVVGDEFSKYSNKAIEYIKDKSLKLAGLQQIKKNEENNINSTKEIDEKINKINNNASELILNAKNTTSNIVNKFDKGSANFVNKINNVLKSEEIQSSLNKTASETAEIGENLLKNFNNKLNTPELKKETKIAIENAADYANITLEAMDKPINNAIDQLNKAGTKATSGIVSGLIKVSTDALAAIPGVGAVVELGKIANDVSSAAGDVIEATNDTTSIISKVVQETKQNIDEEMNKLDEKKKEGEKIFNRTNKSIETFQNPVSILKKSTTGGSKTKKFFLNHKKKTNRVSFSI